jgi:predicted amidophosphoribosyltransferase
LVVKVAGVSVFHELLAVIAPPVCAACGADLPGAEGLVCGGCLRALPWLDARACRRCALPSHRGRACPAWGAAYETAWAPLAYEGVARDLVGALKFRAALPLADLMAAQIAANAPPLPPGAAIVAVPPSRARLRARGFDPAALLARALARRAGLPLEDCLRRRDRAGRQVGAGRSERRTAGRLTIEATRPAPAQVLLVDDVHTTGATLEACARTLRAAGAGAVHALTYARTL